MTTSPTATSSGTRLPLSSIRPGPTAMTLPSWGFSLAVSGITRPDAVVASASLAWTTILSSSGLMFTLTAVTSTGLFRKRWQLPVLLAAPATPPSRVPGRCRRRTVGTLPMRLLRLQRGSPLRLGDHGVDQPPVEIGQLDVGVDAARQAQQCLPQPPAPGPRPGPVVLADRAPERLAALAAEQRPRDHQVGRRVTDGGRAEVDHRRQPPVLDEQVPGGDVPVKPHRGVPIFRGQRGVPHLGGRSRVDPALESFEAAAGLVVVVGGRRAAVPAVLTRRRPTGGVALLQGRQEPG